jgi:hypothetical protein
VEIDEPHRLVRGLRHEVAMRSGVVMSNAAK